MNNNDEQLEHQLRDALTVRSAGPRQHDIDHLRQLASQHIAHSTTPAPHHTRRPATLWAAGAVAASVVGAFFAGTQLRDQPTNPTSAGVAEFNEILDIADSGTITVAGRRTGIGRTVDIETVDLPILPIGAYYEVWFVAADDAPGSPNRISAGTFHPDSNGNTDVSLTAAVDPSKYPAIVITAEPSDGNPAPSDNEVARGNLTITSD